LQENTRCSCIG